MKRRILGIVAASAICALAVGTATPAHAEDEITIDHVASADGTVSVLLAVDGLPPGTEPDPEDVKATVDGTPVDATATTVEAGEIERTTILTLDASNSMRGARIAAAQAAAKAFLEAAPPDVEIGLVTFAGDIQDTIAPTTDHESLAAAVDAIELSSGTSVYDAMVQSVNLAGSDGARSLLVLSDGGDTGSTAPIDEVIMAAQSSGVIVDVVSLDQSAKNSQRLTSISDNTGGKVIPADPDALSDVFTAQADALASQLLVKFAAPVAASEDVSLEVSLSADGVTYSDSAFVTLEGLAEEPTVVERHTPLVGRSALLLGSLALGAGLAAVLAVALLGARGPSPSQRLLADYFSENRRPPGAGVELHTSGLRDQAVALSEKVVKGDFETRLSQRLAGAGSNLTAAEWLLVHAGITVGAAFVGLILRGALLMVVLLLVGAALPWLYLRFKHSRRLARFNAQLAETLGLMAGGLQAGLSLPQAVDTVIREGHEPMAGELKRALIEQRLGVGIEEALDGVSTRMACDDFGWVVMAIRIQREVGGNLAEILNTVAETLREREYLRRQVKSLSAEGRLSGYMLGALPPALFVYLLFANPLYIKPLYTTFIGWMMLCAAVVLLSLGGWMMAKIAKVEV